MEDTSGSLARAERAGSGEGGLPLISEVILDTEALDGVGDDVLRALVAHEVAHALGFGSSRRWEEMLKNAASVTCPAKRCPTPISRDGTR